MENKQYEEVNELVLSTGEFTLEEILNGFLLIDSQDEKRYFSTLIDVKDYMDLII